MEKRIRHTYNIGELFHIFFHRNEEIGYARTPTNNASWVGNICYSYNSEIGYADFDNRIFYFRNGYRSMATSKHQTSLSWAIPKGEWNIIYINKWEDWSRDWNKAPNLQYFVQTALKTYIQNKELLTKNISNFYSPDDYNRTINYVENTLSKAGQMHLYKPFLDEISKHQWTPKEIQMYEVKDWCLKNGIKGSYNTKLKVFNNKELAKEAIEKYKIRKEKLDATKEKRELKALKAKVEKWYTGEIRKLSKLHGGHYYNSYPIYLRINPNNPEEIQTSKGAIVTLQEAKLLYHKFRKCIDENKEWIANGETFSIGYYDVNKIYHDISKDEWAIKAGCHIIYSTQIEEFVNKFVPTWIK